MTNGQNALQSASFRGHLAVVQLLVERKILIRSGYKQQVLVKLVVKLVAHTSSSLSSITLSLAVWHGLRWGRVVIVANCLAYAVPVEHNEGQ